MQSFILHHISQPRCCTHKRWTVIQVNPPWAAFPCDESLQGTDKLFCLHGFRQFEVQGTAQAASVQDYIGFSLSVSANTVLYWTRIVNPDDLKGRSFHSTILRQVLWRGVGVCNSMKPLASVAKLIRRLTNWRNLGTQCVSRTLAMVKLSPPCRVVSWACCTSFSVCISLPGR